MCSSIDPVTIGDELHGIITDLFPIPRSITGAGVRETLRRVSETIPLEVHEVPSGTQVLDWTVPPEWSVREAWIRGPDGQPVVNLADSFLHLVSYSEPVRRTMSLRELRPHLFSLPDRPAWTPYRTSYYERNWGFCLPHDRLASLVDGEYEVCVDSTLDPSGSLTYGEAVINGAATTGEVLISTHVCHPSLANDNLSGIAIAMLLGRQLLSVDSDDLRYTYRFLFIPGTIGSITWLDRNADRLDTVRHGLVLTGLGDEGAITYKRSRRGDATIDRATEHVLGCAEEAFTVVDFSPYGYDERQFGSPGFDLPVGRISRTPHGEYPEYHTSADDLDFVSPRALGRAFATIMSVLEVLEGDDRYVNLNPRGEPQLGRRGLYRATGGDVDRASAEMALLWVLNLSDGAHSLLDIATRSGLRFAIVRDAARLLAAHDLLALQ